MKNVGMYLAGAAVTALVVTTGIPNDAAADIIGELGFTANGAVTIQNAGHQNLPNIVPALRFKTYADASINIPGSGIFAGATDITQGGNQQIVFNVPTGLGDNIDDFSLTVEMPGPDYTITLTTADLHSLNITTGQNAGGFVADYNGTITAGPDHLGASTILSQSCNQSALGGPISCSNTLTTSSVPEPASLALLSTALIGLAPMLRRRRKDELIG